MGRTISPIFAQDLECGVLAELLSIIRNDDELIICFRKDYLNVYYKSHSIFKIEEQDKKYKFVFNLGHARYINTFDSIKNELDAENVEAKIYRRKDDDGNPRYSYSAVFSVKKNINDSINFKSIINIYKRYIDDFFKGGTRDDLFENVKRNTNSLREKRHQQALFSKHLISSDELLFYDMELSLPKPIKDSKEDKTILKEVGKYITGAPDCLAVKLEDSKVTKIVLVEVKSTKQACVGDNGIYKHDKDFNDIIKCSYYREFIAESMKETLKLYANYGLCGNVIVPDGFGKTEEAFEILYFFTHDEVINWIKNSGEDNKDNMKTYRELYRKNPDMFKFVNEEMQSLLGKYYD